MILKIVSKIKKVCKNTKLNNDSLFLKEIENCIIDLKNFNDENIDDNIDENIDANIDDNIRDYIGTSEFMSETENKIKTKKKIGELFFDKGILNTNEIDDLLKLQKETYPDLKFGQIVLKEKKAPSNTIIELIRLQSTTNKSNYKEDNYLKVSHHKVDTLISMMKDLSIIESLIEKEAKLINIPNAMKDIEKLSKLTQKIQNISMSLRMVSLKLAFDKIKIICNETLKELDKKAFIEISGEDIEVDRNISEKIVECLMHIVKNSISHGLENEHERIELGKSPKGTIKIDAYRKSGNIIIEISDDGNGISTDKLLQKAISKKIVDSKLKYSNSEILDFIFMPGFSTSKTVNSISGRGVGLDVVKTEISRIGGKVELTSNVGVGTVFVLIIPIDLAVMNGTVVDIRGATYIIPSANIKKILSFNETKIISTLNERKMIYYRESMISILPITNILGMDGGDDINDNIIIIIESKQKLKALQVTNIIGKYEITVKPLEDENYTPIFILGSSIMSDGKVSLIIDPETLFRMECDY